MARKKTATDTLAGQHLALSLAAQLARTQLVRDPLATYDAQHNTEMLDFIGTALARTGRLCLLDIKTGQLRELTPTELAGAQAKRGATVLELQDGQKFSGVSIRRSDLRHAITILRAVGLTQPRTPTEDPARVAQPASSAARGTTELRARLTELETLLELPLLPRQVEQANALAVQFARHAPHGRIANLAMRLLSEVHEARSGGNEENVRVALARLRGAVEELTTTL